MGADNVLGGVSIVITGDLSTLQSDFGKAQKLAQQAGSQISSALNASLSAGIKGATQLVDQFGRAFPDASAAAADLAKQLKLASDEANRMAAETTKAADRVVASLNGATAATKESAKEYSSFVGIIPGLGVAAERFVGLIPGLGQALVAAFPVFGAIALAEGLARISEKVISATSNFYLMAEAMQEVRQVGVELAKEAEKAIDHINELQVASLREQGKLVAAAVKEMEGLVNKPIQLPSLEEPDRKKKLSSLNSDELPKLSAVYSEVLPQDIPQRIKEINEGIARTNAELKTIKESGFDPLFLNTRYAKQDVAALDLYGDALQFLQIKQQEFATAAGKASADIGKAQTDEQKKREENARAGAEVLKRQAAEMKQADELELAQMKSLQAVSVGDLIKFWEEKLAIEGNGAQRSREIQITLGNLYQEQDKVIQKIAERGAKLEEAEAVRLEKQKSFLSKMAFEADDIIAKINSDIAKINAQIAVAKARTDSQGNENVLAQQRLQVERDYALLIAKTAQSQIDYAQQIAANSKAEAAEKIRLLEVEKSLALTEKERAEIDDKIAKARGAAANKEFADQTRIQQLIQQNTALGKVQIGLWNTFNGIFGKLSQGIASAIVHAQNFGQAMTSIVQSIGQEILQTLIGAALGALQKALASQVAAWLGLKAVSSALNVAEVASEAAVGGAAAFASTAAIPIIGPALAPAAGAAAYAAILGTYGPLAAFDTGGLVPETMMALVHKGEWVTPAAQVAQGISGPRSGGDGQQILNFHVYGGGDPKRVVREIAKYMKSAGGMRFSPAASS